MDKNHITQASGHAATLSTAQLQWIDGQPCSQQFDDIYFSPGDGFAETEHVFLHHNHLAERWSSLAPNSDFTIGETGFGTGLNFLCAAALWLELAPSTGTLHYISSEKYPLSLTDLTRTLNSWTNNRQNETSHIPSLAQQLSKQYPPPLPGFHRLEFSAGRIQLTLLFGDSLQQFSELQSSDHPLFVDTSSTWVDAWFLDGFAPAKNPEMWSPALFTAIANLSHANTTFATFTAAGNTRRGLAAVGFEVEKVLGYGNKREMLRGKLLSNKITQSIPRVRAAEKENPYLASKRNSSHPPPWYLHLRDTQSIKDKRVAVIGAGIAGCATADALAQRGWQVSLYDQKGIAKAASGNPQGILYPKLSIKPSAFARINLAALVFAIRYYRPFWDRGNYGQASGVLQLPTNTREKQHFQQLSELYRQVPEFVRGVNKTAIEQVSGLSLAAENGLFFPQLGWVTPPEICQHLSDHPRIKLIPKKVKQLQRNDDKQLWELNISTSARHGTPNNPEYPFVVLANAANIRQFEQTQHLPLSTIRGQISVSPATNASLQLNTVVCGEGYLAPAHNKYHSFGASYDLKHHDTEIRREDHQINLRKLKATDPALASLLSPIESLSGRAALRCVTPDYLPLAGPAPKYSEFLQDFALLRKNARSHIPVPGAYWPGLYINCGHGSRGFTYAPLCAALIADAIENTPPPLERTLRTALNPARFIIRDLKRSLV